MIIVYILLIIYSINIIIVVIGIGTKCWCIQAAM